MKPEISMLKLNDLCDYSTLLLTVESIKKIITKDGFSFGKTELIFDKNEKCNQRTFALQ